MNARTLRLAGGIALVTSALLATGCRTNLLPEYANRIESAHVVSVTPDGPDISIGSEQHSSILTIAADVAALGVSAELARKFAEGTSPDEVSAQMADVFVTELDRSFDWTVQPDVKADYDTRIDVRITEYGLFAESPSSPALFRMRIEATMFYRPESKLIWEYSTTYTEPLNPIDVRAHGGASPDARTAARVVNTGVNLALLNELTPDELRLVFMNLARKAGARLVDQIRKDTVD